MMLGQRAATSDLDIVRMGADRQHALLLPFALRADGLGEQKGLLHELGRRLGLEQQGIDAALDRLAHEMRALVGGDHHRGEPAMVFLDLLKQREAAGQHRIDGDEIVELARHHPRAVSASPA